MTLPALELAERIVKRAPLRLSELEAVVGPLNVDSTGPEGTGPFTRADASSLPKGLIGLSIDPLFDVHHEDPKRPRDLRFRAVRYDFDAPPDGLARVVGSSCGTPRVFGRDDGTWFEYRVAGADRGFVYLHPVAARTTLYWEHARPQWAHAHVPDDARRTLLAHVIAALMVSDAPKQVVARIRSQLVGGGATVDTWATTVWVQFKPSVPLAVVVGALGWKDPLAYSGDVHQESWTVIPAELLRRNAREPNIGRWRVNVRLAERPTDVPTRGYHGPSSLYELESKPFDVASIYFERA